MACRSSKFEHSCLYDYYHRRLPHQWQNIYMRLWGSLVLFYSSHGIGFSCTCQGGIPPCEAYWNASVVFSGTVARLSTTSIEEKLGERVISYPKLSASFDVDAV